MVRFSVVAKLLPLLFGFGLMSTLVRAAATDRPNIVVLLADDMGFADVGFQGAKDIPTPHIDALARSGVRCTNGYVSGPYCSPTRAGLLTGRYQQRFGHEFNPGGEAGLGKLGMPVSETTLVERLRASGYHTGLVGKWHLGNAPQFRPQKRGFDEFFGFLGGGHTYFAGKSHNIYRGTEEVTESTYLTDAFQREAVAFIDRNKAQPFFLELAFNAVHTPMEATSDRLEQFTSIPNKTRKTYAAMLSALDDAVGAVTTKLRESGLEEKTLIFFINDNGGPTMLGTTINGSRNTPYRGSKRTTLEGGIHIPFVASWKGKLPAGQTFDKPVIQLDILPTALAAADVAIDPAWNIDGVNLLPFLTDPAHASAPHDSLFWRFGSQDAIRKGDWKLVRYDDAMDTGKRSRIADVEVTPRRLYNLASDPGEVHDLAAENPGKVQELRAAWQDWDKQLVPPLWGPEGGVGGGGK